MAVGTAPQAPVPAPSFGQVIGYEQFIEGQIKKTRQQVKWIDLTGGLMLLLGGALAYLFVVAILEHWILPGGLGAIGRWLAMLGLLGGGAWFFARTLLPLFIKRINPVYAAHAIEQRRPSLKNSLVNFLLLRGSRAGVSDAVYHAIEQQAATNLSEVEVEAALDRTRLVKIFLALAGVVVLLGLYGLLSPKPMLQTMRRVIFPWANIATPTQVTVTEVEPGDTNTFHDGFVEVKAVVKGLGNDDDVTLFYSTLDGQTVEQPVPMLKPADSYRHVTMLPAGTAGLQQTVKYYVAAGDARSRWYQVEVRPAPTITVDRVELTYPKYTKLEKGVQPQGDVKAIEGTRVELFASTNQGIKSADIDFDCVGRRVKPLTLSDKSAVGEFVLRMHKDGRTPEHTSYQLRFTNRDGYENPRPIRHQIEVLRDQPPEVKFVEPPQGEIELPANGSLPLKLLAKDADYALAGVDIVAEPAEQRGKVLFAERLLAKEQAGEFTADYVFQPEKHKLKAGDVIRLWAEAKDNRQPDDKQPPKPNLAQTDKLTIVIKEPLKQDQQNKQPNQQNPKPDDKQQPNQPQQKQPNDKQQDPNKGPQDPNQKPQDQGDKDPTQPPPKNDPNQKNQEQNGDKQQQPNDKQQNQGGKGAEKPQDQNQQNKDEQNTDEQNKDQQNKDGNRQDPKQQQDQNQQQNDQQNKQQQGDAKNQQGGSGASGGQSKQQKQQGSGQGASQNEQRTDPDANPGDAFDKINRHREENQPQGDQQNKQPKQQPNQDGQPSEPKEGDNQGKQPQGGQQEKQPQQGGGKTSQQQQPADGPKNGGQQNAEQKPGEQPEQGAQDQNAQQGKPNAAQKPAGEKQGNPLQQTGGKQQQPADEQPKLGEKAKPGEEPKKNGQPKSGEQSNAGEKAPAGQQQAGDNNNPPPGAGDKQAGEKPGDKPGEKPVGKNQENPNPSDKPKEGGKPAGEQGKQGGEKQPGQAAKSADNGAERSQQGTKPEAGDGAEVKGNGDKQSPEKQPGKQAGDKQEEKQPPQGGDRDNEKGNAPGDGKKSADENPSPAAQGANQPKQPQQGKPPAGEQEKMPGGESAKSPSNSKQQSDAKGETSGDRSGDGEDGGGQQAKKEGTGGPGSNTPSDQGANKAPGPGDGEKSDQGGEKAPAEKPTGKQDPTQKPGEGSGSKPGDKSQQPGGKKLGEKTQDGGQENPTPEKQPGKPEGDSSKSPSGAGKPGGGQAKPGEAPEGGEDNEPGEHQGGAEAKRPPKSSPPEAGEAANMEYAKKATDLAIGHLKDELAKDKPDQSLLDKLKWTREDAQRFVDRWEQMKQQAQRPGAPGDAAKRKLEESLKGLGLRPQGTAIKGTGQHDDTQRNLKDSRRTAPPSEYSDQLKAYKQGIAKGQK